MLPEQERSLKKLLTVVTVVSLALAILFGILYFVGYGKFSYQLSETDRLYINNNYVNDDLIKNGELSLRPGTYAVRLQSSKYTTSDEQVRIGWFSTLQYEPKSTERQPNQIASAALGATGTTGPPTLTGTRWFQDDSWVAGLVGPSSATPAAFEYVNGEWIVRYLEANGYESNEQDLPSDVAKYIIDKTRKVRQQ